MKKAGKLIIKKWINDRLIESNERLICGYCESGEVYPLKKKQVIFCRKCGKESIL